MKSITKDEINPDASMGLPLAPLPFYRIIRKEKHSEFHITSRGEIFASGYNLFGQLGAGSQGRINGLQEIKTTAAICNVALGAHHTIILSCKGKLYAAGSNHFHQLGIAGIDKTGIFKEIKFLAGKNPGVKLIAAGVFHNLALTIHNELYVWGNNSRGQLGLGNEQTITTPKKISAENFAGEEIVSMAAGLSFSVILTNAGNVYTCGDNSSGQLGRPGEPGKFMPVAGLKNIKAIVTGDSHVLALTRHGELFGWGYNGLHQIDNSATKEFLSPKLICNSVAAIFCVADLSLILTENSPQACFIKLENNPFSIECRGKIADFTSQQLHDLKETMIQQYVYDKQQKLNQLAGVKQSSSYTDIKFFFGYRKKGKISLDEEKSSTYSQLIPKGF
ncbi:hypothetical protein NKV53_03990 [Legionella sp. 27cVA30]|uniref:RCC1 domain-containing protein n=1 Tax=Legionella TaxID=445 RepID=UPI000F8D326F|nr:MULTISPECIES: hypothetical protein [Legionella]MCP0913528.1 hypothetical protein [Legionella sp. 27cVA30]RUR15211.1 hypothetical protein ELY10_06295 [Legionella septentrionalis]